MLIDYSKNYLKVYEQFPTFVSSMKVNKANGSLKIFGRGALINC